MTVLPNFPHIDQRTERTADGRPPENGNYDCVDVSFAAAIGWLDGVYVSGDELKDAEYGEAYRNAGTSLARYVDQATDTARAKYHVTADPFTSSDPHALVAQIHAWVDAGYPVIATIPSAWGSTAVQLGVANRCAPSVSSHVIVFFETGVGTLTAMNPWGGFDHSGSDQYWADRLLFCQVWRIHKDVQVQEVPAVIVIDGSGAHDPDTGNKVGQGLAADIAAAAKQDPSILGQHILVGETYTGDHSGAVISGWDGKTPRYLAAYSKSSNLHRLVDFAEGAGLLSEALGLVASGAQSAQKDAQIKSLSDQVTALSEQAKQLQAQLDQATHTSDAQRQVLATAAQALKPLADAFTAVDAASKAA